MEEGIIVLAALIGELFLGRVLYWTGYLLLKAVTFGTAEVAYPNPIRNPLRLEEGGQRVGFPAWFARVIGFVFWVVVVAVFVVVS